MLTNSNFHSIQSKNHTRIHRRFLQNLSQLTLHLLSALYQTLFIAAMAAATRSILGAVAAIPASGDMQSQADKLRPNYGFQTRILRPIERRGRRGVSAGGFTRSELQVFPVSPEDAPKVSGFVRSMICFCFCVLF